jgi:hypothetical protein
MSNRDFRSLKVWSVANARIYFEEVRNMNLHGKVAVNTDAMRERPDIDTFISGEIAQTPLRRSARSWQIPDGDYPPRLPVPFKRIPSPKGPEG